MKTRFTGRTWRHPGNQALVLLLLALFVMLAAVPAASASSSASPAAGEGTTFRVGWLLEPDNLNPFIGLLGQDYEIWHLNYDFLVGFEAKDLSPKPELAESWTVSDDGKTWTFKIRQGVKWQDGEPLTAKDVAFTYNYIVKNDLQTLAIYTGGITGAVATDDYTVDITTEKPKSNMLAMVVPIIPEHIWSKVSGKAATTTYQNEPPIIGSGPFQTVEWSQGKYIRMVANKDYWGGKPKVDELFFENYKSADTMTADLKQGAIDAAVELPQAQYPSVVKTAGVTGLKGTHWRFNELGFNCYDSPDSMGNPVLLDPKFRQALNWAIDRQKIVDVAFFGQADTGSTLIVPYSTYHWEPAADQAYKYDPEETKTQLDLAGYEDTDGDGFRETKDGKPLSLRLLVTNDSPENQTAAKLIAGWFKDVGLKVNLKIVDAGVLLDAQYNYKGDTYAPDYDMYIWFWTYDVDPEMMLGVPTPQQIEGWNDTLWTDPEYTEPVHAAGADDRRREAHPAGAADAGDRLGVLPVPDLRLSVPAGGVPQRQVGRRRPLAVGLRGLRRRGVLQLHERRHLQAGPAQGGDGDGREQQQLDHDHHRGRGRRDHHRAHRGDAAAAARPLGGDVTGVDPSDV